MVCLPCARLRVRVPRPRPPPTPLSTPTLLLLVLILLQYVSHATASCSLLGSWNKCSQVLNYTVDDSICQQDDVLFDTTSYASLSPSCRVAVSRVQCASRYPPCSVSSTNPLPSNLCVDVTNSCTALTDRALVAGLNMSQPWTCSNNTNTTQTSTSSLYQFVPAAPTGAGYRTCFMLPVNSICATYLTGPVMLQYNTSMASAASAIDSAGAGAGVVSDQTCHDLYYEHVCRSNYLPCENVTYETIATINNTNTTMVPVNVTLTVPALACRSVCQNLLNNCNPILKSFIHCNSQTTYTSCNGTTIVTYDNYPDFTTTPPSIPFPRKQTVINATSTTNPKGLVNTQPTCSAPPPKPAPVTCMPLPPSSVCSGVLAYQIPNDTCVTSTEATLDVRTWVALSPICRDAVAKYTCTNSYKQLCQAGVKTAIKPSADVCVTLKSCLQDTNSTSYLVLSKILAMDPNTLSCDDGTTTPTPTPAPTNPTSETTSNTTLYITPATPLYSQCETYTGSICRGLIKAPIFASASPSPQQLEQMLGQLVPALPFIPTAFGCRDNVMRLFCAHVFPTCNTNAVRDQLHVDVDIPMPTFPSQSACQLASSSCSMVQQTCLASGADPATCPNWMTSLQLNCSDQLIIGGCGAIITEFPSFPTVTQNISGFPGNNLAAIIITPNPANQSMDGFVIPCPDPLITPDNWNSPNIIRGGSCALPCTSIVFPPSTWKRGLDVFQVIGIMSLICATFLNIAWLLPTAKIDSKKWGPLHWFAISVWWCSLALTLAWFKTWPAPAGLDPRAGAFCKSNSEVRTQADGGLCLAQSVLFNFWLTASTIWFFGTVLDAVLLVLFESNRWPTKVHQIRLGVYHVTAWSFALSYVLMQTDGHLGATGNTPFCGGNIGNGIPWSYGMTINGLFIIPTVLGGFIVLGVVLYSASISSSNAPSGSSSSRKIRIIHKFFKLFRIYLRLFILVIIYTSLIIYSYKFSVTAHIDNNAWTQALGDWVLCAIDPTNLDKSKCHRPNTISDGDFVGLCAVTAVMGCLVTLVYGRKEDFIAWYNFVILGLNRVGITRFEKMGIMQSSTTDTTTGNNSHRSHNNNKSNFKGPDSTAGPNTAPTTTTLHEKKSTIANPRPTRAGSAYQSSRQNSVSHGESPFPTRREPLVPITTSAAASPLPPLPRHGKLQHHESISPRMMSSSTSAPWQQVPNTPMTRLSTDSHQGDPQTTAPGPAASPAATQAAPHHRAATANDSIELAHVDLFDRSTRTTRRSGSQVLPAAIQPIPMDMWGGSGAEPPSGSATPTQGTPRTALVRTRTDSGAGVRTTPAINRI